MQKTILALATVALLAANSGFAATLTWDTNSGTAGGQGGTGVWNMTNTNWWDGSANVVWNDNNDVVLPAAAGTITLGADITIGSNTTNLILNATASGYQIDGDVGGLYKLTIDGTGGSGGYRRGIDGTLTINAPVVLKGYSLDLRSGTKTINGVIADDGISRTLTNQGGSTLILNNENTFKWNITNLGTLVIGHDQALGTGTLTWGTATASGGAPIQAANGHRTIANTVNASNWNNFMVMGGHDSLTITSTHNLLSAWGGTSTYQVVESDSVLTFNTLSKTPSQAGGLTKTGAGTLVIVNYSAANGCHTYVNGGTLLINGTATAAGSGYGYTVASGARLGGNGTINVASGGVVTVNAGTSNGILAPGESVGELTINGTVDLNGTLEIEIDGSGADKLVVNGLLDLDPSSSVLNVVFINGFTPTGAETYDILDWGTLAGSFSQINLVQPGGYFRWDDSQLLTDGILLLNIPEPASALLLGLAGLAALRRRR